MTTDLRPTVVSGSAALLTLGVAAGALSGILGVGGGLVMVPIMVLGLAFDQRSASATSLAAIAPIAAVGVTVLGSVSLVSWPVGLVVGAAAAIGSQFGSAILARAPEQALRVAFALFLLAVAGALAIR